MTSQSPLAGFRPSLPPCRPADPERAARGIERLRAVEGAAGAVLAAALDDERLGPFLVGVLGGSPFLGACMDREPEFLAGLLADGPDAARTRIEAELDALTPERERAAVMAGLRVARRRIALLTALCDIAGLWSLEAVTGTLSWFAQRATAIAAAHLLRGAHDRGDLALPDPERPEHGSGYIIIGMGKLGAGELNYSSDIDLIVLFDGERFAYRGRKSARECAVALTRDLVAMLETPTADGYVHRTDLRLRPDPGSTAVALSVEAAEIYYESMGQNWERAAMIKARAIAGDIEAGERFLRGLRPFVWRRHLDFDAIRDIHSIKRQIHSHKGGGRIGIAGHDVKLGRGGIREIEFFVQTQQLIWGGRQPELRLRRTIDCLDALVELGHISPTARDDMAACYRALRQVEHRLQMIDDQQTQKLPSDWDAIRRLGVFLGHESAEAFAADLREVLETVQGHYARLFEDSPGLGAEEGGVLVFTGVENDPETLKTLARLGFANPEAVSSTIRAWHHGRYRATRTVKAREALTELTPVLLRALAATGQPDTAFLRMDEFIRNLPAGVQIFSMCRANPRLLGLLAELLGGAPRLATHLARNTSLVEMLLAPGFLEALPSREELAEGLATRVAASSGFEEMLGAFRRWANDERFQVGVLTLFGRIDPERSGHLLSLIAEIALDQLLAWMEADYVRTHGRVPGGGMVILALGRLGAQEMSDGSDLDLVFVYDHDTDASGSDGRRPLAPGPYYGRLVQGFVNALTALTPDGVLYPVDMRLRPSGSAGPLAVSLAAFDKYQQEAAWTWEHMALTKARVVAGPRDLAEKVRAAVCASLTRRRDPATLAANVADMRSRMAKEHRAASVWEIKHWRGGLVDVEFIAQYLQLAHAHAHPEILRSSTDAGLAALADAGVLAAEDAATLRDCHTRFLAVQGLLRQTVDGVLDEETAPAPLRERLSRLLDERDLPRARQRLEGDAARVLAIFERLVEKAAARETPYTPSDTTTSSQGSISP